MDENLISIVDGKLQVPDAPVIPFIEGDGTGPDIWAASVRVIDAAVEKAYSGAKKLSGKKFWRAKRLLTKPETGCPKKRWMHSGITK